MKQNCSWNIGFLKIAVNDLQEVIRTLFSIEKQRYPNAGNEGDQADLENYAHPR